jgi:ornithine cyclodeaminase/alanine dehydrogenase-like protein (mu-crystallin family)
MSTLRVLTEQQVRISIDLPAARQAVEVAYAEHGRTPEIQSLPPVMTIAGPRPTLGRAALGQYRVKGAAVPKYEVAGAFMATRDHPYMYLWSAETDAPIGLVACDWLSQYRVAITAAVAIERLAKHPVKKIVLFGAGKYAKETCRLVAANLPDAQLHLLAAHVANAERVAAEMPRSVVASDAPREAIEGADVIVTLTTTRTPIVPGGWLSEGALLLSMGSAHEADIAVLRESDGLIVDDLAYACIQGDIAAWIARKELDPGQLRSTVRATIGEVVAGLKVGREHPNERILAIIQGLTACDVALAKAVLDQATAAGIGQTVEI